MKKQYIIALDIGGTKIEGAVFNNKCRILKKERFYFDKKSTDTLVNTSRKIILQRLCDMIDGLAEDYSISGIGISYPDIILTDNTIFKLSKINALRGFDLAEYLRKKYKVKTAIANDADCFALAEQKLGAGRGYKNVVGIIIGTGVGAGLIINGEIYKGTVGSGGEFGRNIVNPHGPKDRVGFRGSVESYAGGPNLVKNYLARGGKLKKVNPSDIFRSKEKAAREAFDDWFEYLGIGLASIMNFLNPGVIVMGGGLSNLPIYKRLNRITKKYTVGGFRKHVKVVKNKMGDSGAIYGAAILVQDK